MDYFTRPSIRKERSTQLLRSVEINIFRLSPLLSVMISQFSINALSMRCERKVGRERLVFDGVESKRYSLGFEFLVGTCDRCVRATF